MREVFLTPAAARPTASIEGSFWSAAAAASSDPGRLRGGIAQARPPWASGLDPGPGARLLPRIKLIVLIARRPDLSPADFHRYWLRDHAALAIELAGDVGLQRYVQSHEIAPDLSVAIAEARGWNPTIFEGVTEGWWNDEAALREALASPAGQRASARLIEDERRFSDQRCMAMITAEYEILDRDRPIPADEGNR